jgi:hypothetical protein
MHLLLMQINPFILMEKKFVVVIPYTNDNNLV